MKKIISLFCLVLSSYISIAQKEYHNIQKTTASFQEGEDILIVLFNKMQCFNCNSSLNKIFEDKALKDKISSNRRFIVTDNVREIEKEGYFEKFKFLSPAPEMIFNKDIYHSLQQKLKTSSIYEGGIIVLDKDSNVKCQFTFSDRAYIEKLKQYIIARN